MSTYPWGPHGPQSGPNEVTPNPTPAYVPPPPMPSYSAPTPSYGPSPSYSSAPSPASYGGGSVDFGPSGPRHKHYFIALILTFIFGPLGLFYATKKGGMVMLFLLVGVPVTLGMIGVLPFGSPSHPLAILDHSSVMDPMWSLSVFVSMVWSVFAVKSYNSALKVGD